MRLFFLLLLLLICFVNCKKHHHESEEDEEPEQTNGEKIVDRLAVNLAGALVKSMFPEMDRPSKTSAPVASPEIRRAPANNMMLDGSLANYNAAGAMQNYNAIPQQMQMNESPGNPFAYQQKTPYQSPSYQNSMPSGVSAMQSALGMGSMANIMAAGSGSPQELNAVKNRQYLAQLARHQAELNAYSAKQMEYLDNQRRYQQSMVDHQAGAALLMQQQQQQAINEQMKKLQESYGQKEHYTEDNTVGGRVLTRTHGTKTYEPKPPKRSYSDDDVLTGDAHLQKFFREHYGIDFHTNGEKLTEDERNTLRELKRELMKNKEKAIRKGSFKTMESLKSKVSRGHSYRSSSERLASAPEHMENCAQCMPMDMSMIKGAWTQMYGNPNVVKRTFRTLMSLEQASLEGGRTRMSKKNISCVGMEIGKFSKGSSNLNLFYREAAEGNQLHEMHGEMTKEDRAVINVDTNMLHNKYCLVKAGPSDVDRYEYMVLAETQSKYACRSYHVFARNTDEFNRRHFDDVSEFMKNEVVMSDILPVAAFPKASLCQLERP